jgi:phosphatidylglycerophosphate synthase
VLKDLIFGHLSVAARIWTAAAPALVLLAYFAIGIFAYRIRCIARGPWRDTEAEAREGGGLTVRPVRVFFAWLMRPWVDLLVRLEIPPNAITSLSLALSLAAGLALAMGRFALGGWLYVGAGFCDFFDGTVARRTGRVTPAGGVLDSVLDRYSEAAVLLGLAWFYRDRWVLVPVLAAFSGSLLVPYVRARGEAMGAALASVGFMQRPERVLLVGTTVSLSPILEAIIVPEDPRPLHRLAVIGITALAVGTHLTAATRTRHLMRAVRPAQASEAARGSSIRDALAVMVGAGADYGLLHLIADVASVPMPITTMVAYCAGAIIALSLLGAWARIPAPHGLSAPTFWLFVVGSGAVLNGGGVAIVELVPALGLPLSWLAVRLIVLLTWTRPLLGEGLRARLGLPEAPGGSAS